MSVELQSSPIHRQKVKAKDQLVRKKTNGRTDVHRPYIHIIKVISAQSYIKQNDYAAQRSVHRPV